MNIGDMYSPNKDSFYKIVRTVSEFTYCLPDGSFRTSPVCDVLWCSGNRRNKDKGRLLKQFILSNSYKKLYD